MPGLRTLAWALALVVFPFAGCVGEPDGGEVLGEEPPPDHPQWEEVFLVTDEDAVAFLNVTMTRVDVSGLDGAADEDAAAGEPEESAVHFLGPDNDLVARERVVWDEGRDVASLTLVLGDDEAAAFPGGGPSALDIGRWKAQIWTTTPIEVEGRLVVVDPIADVVGEADR